ncbi:MAG: hypothetical protein OXI81_16875 [Paracoccaceae bacterium]|nr:hypothetical protein [Paracoccaceae bacterium]
MTLSPKFAEVIPPASYTGVLKPRGSWPQARLTANLPFCYAPEPVPALVGAFDGGTVIASPPTESFPRLSARPSHGGTYDFIWPFLRANPVNERTAGAARDDVCAISEPDTDRKQFHRNITHGCWPQVETAGSGSLPRSVCPRAHHDVENLFAAVEYILHGGDERSIDLGNAPPWPCAMA